MNKKIPFKVFIKNLLSIGLFMYVVIVISLVVIYGIKYLYNFISIYDILNWIREITTTPVGIIFIVPAMLILTFMICVLIVYLIF